MCTAAEAKTLQRVYGRYNSFFRKVIPIKRVQKPVRWYTRLTVYGNPGRVVNGCAPGIPVLICGFGVVVCGGGCSGVCGGYGVRPRSSHYGKGGAPHISSAPTQGHPSPGRSAPPRSASESVRADTLRAHPENAAAPARHPATPSEERRYRPNVTSGCPKRSEGGSPVGTRTNTAFRAESKRPSFSTRELRS